MFIFALMLFHTHDKKNRWMKRIQTEVCCQREPTQISALAFFFFCQRRPKIIGASTVVRIADHTERNHDKNALSIRGAYNGRYCNLYFKQNLDTTKPGLGYHSVAKPGITDRTVGGRAGSLR